MKSIRTQEGAPDAGDAKAPAWLQTAESVALAVAAVVVTVGSLPFVGLVVPNVVSRLWGDNLRANLPLVAVLGGFMVLAADVIGRLVRFPYEIPAATIFAIFGAAVFLWLLHAPRSVRHG